MSAVFERSRVLDAFPVLVERLSPKRLLELDQEERANIREIAFELPTIGSKTFGSFVVHYKNAFYAVRR